MIELLTRTGRAWSATGNTEGLEPMTRIDTIEIDPRPFGPSSGTPAIRASCRIMSVRPYPSTEGPAGFETAITICIETPEGIFEMTIDERSANFLAHALLFYAKPFQSFNRAGTPLFETANPST